MSTFKVGEVAIVAHVVNPAVWGNYLGAEVEVISELHMNFMPTLAEEVMVHRVMTADGKTALCRPQDLRKKRPPEETGSWDRIEEVIGWKPEAVPA